MAGRDREIQECFQKLNSDVTALKPATAIIGHYGSGKTVALKLINEEAERAGYAIISAKIHPGFAADLAQASTEYILEEYGQGGWVLPGTHDLPVTKQSEAPTGLEGVLAAAKAQGKRVLISMDDVRPHLLDDFAQIAKFVRVARYVGERVSLVYSGLPSLFGDPANTNRAGILNDSWWIFLKEFEIGEAESVLREPFDKAGIRIEDEALAYAARVSAGHPFLVQLIGYHLWRDIERTGKGINITSVDEALTESMKDFTFSVLESSLRNLSSAAHRYLAVMARHDSPVQLSAANEQLGYDGDDLPWECIELAHRDLIHRHESGRTVFSIPYTHDYLRSPEFQYKFDYLTPDPHFLEPG